MAHDVLALGVFFVCFLCLYLEALRYWDLGMSGQFRASLERDRDRKRSIALHLDGNQVLLALGLILVYIPALIAVPLWAYLLFPRDSPLGGMMGTVSAFGALVGLTKAQRWLWLKIVDRSSDR